jgi:tetratricopeptide (TPR) repeat protein
VLLFNLCQFSPPISACIRVIRGQIFRAFRVFRGYIFFMNWRRFIPLLIVVAGIAAYHNSFMGQFIFDDIKGIVNNDQIRRFWPPSHAMIGSSRPLVEWSLALSYATGKLNPFDYHLFNLIVHLLAGLTLYGVVKRTLMRLSRASEVQSFRALETTDIVGQPLRLANQSDNEPAATGAVTLQLVDSTEGREQARGYSDQATATLAGVIALIWMVHPLNTQAVTYIIQRGESMMGLFYLLTLYCFIRAIEQNDHRPQTADDRLDTGGPYSVMASGMGDIVDQVPRLAETQDKATTATGAVALQSSVHSPQSTVSSLRQSRAYWFSASIVACCAGMLCKEVMFTAPAMVLLYDRLFVAGSWRSLLRQRVLFYVLLLATCAIPVTLSMRSFTEEGSAGFGLKEFSPIQYALTQPDVILQYLRLAVWPMGLCFDYLWPVAQGFWQIAPPLLVVLGLLVLTLYLFYRTNALAFPGLWFFGILSVSSSVIPIADIAVEHRMYMPLISIIVLVVMTGYRAMARFVGLLAKKCIALEPWFPRLAVAGAVALCALLAYMTIGRNKDYHDQLGMWEKTCHQRPANIRVHIGIADIYFNQQMPKLAKEYCQNVVRLAELKPAHFGASLWLAKAYFYAGSDEQTERQLDKLLNESPENSQAVNLKGLLRYRQGRDQEAADLFAQAIRMNPIKAEFYFNQGLALMRLSRYEEAKASFIFAVQRDQYPYMAYHQLGLALTLLGQQNKAIEAWRSALSINPDHVPTLTELVWLFSVSPDSNNRNGSQALVLGEHLMRLRAKPTRPMLEAVAAAYAENNLFDMAVKMAEQATTSDPPAEKGSSTIPSDGLEHRLNLYHSRKPFRLN